MRGDFWVLTYRRPERVRAVVEFIQGRTERRVNVVCPDDESYLFPGTVCHQLDPKMSHVGTGAPRFAACAWATEQGDDIATLVDDDVFLEPGSDMEALFSSFDAVSDLGMLTGVRRHGPEFWQDELRKTQFVGSLMALRISAYEAAGGFDWRCTACEDTDLELRIRLAGYLVMAHLQVHYHNRPSTIAGGLQAHAQERHEMHRLWTDYVVGKYPEGCVEASLNGGTWWAPKRARRFREFCRLYKAGGLQLTATEVRVL